MFEKEERTTTKGAIVRPIITTDFGPRGQAILLMCSLCLTISRNKFWLNFKLNALSDVIHR